MGLADRWRERRVSSGMPRWNGRSGLPPSGNGASSFHLFWDAPERDWVRAEVTVEIVAPPTVPRLHFWALQVSFTDGDRPAGAGHLGPQWCTLPEGPAINWGGYGARGGELRGSTSPLPSRWGNVNTRDFPWQPGTPYRLRVLAAPPSDAPPDTPTGTVAWRGEIEDLRSGFVSVVRHLYAPGATLAAPMVWSEVFAACDDPGVVVRWSDLALHDRSGRRVVVESARVNYQSLGEGGCVTTDITVDDRGFVQSTGVERRTPQGATLRLG